MIDNSSKFWIILSCLILDIFFIAIYLHSKYLEYRIYKCYKNMFEQLKIYHKMRYKLYFGGEKSEIDEYTKEIEKTAQVLFEVGENIIQQKYLNKRRNEEIKQIMEQTKGLLKTQKS